MQVGWHRLSCVALPHFVLPLLTVGAGCAGTRDTQKSGVTMATTILDAKKEQLNKAQAKITYKGVQSKPVPTVAFYSAGYTMSFDRFYDVERSAVPYGYDNLETLRQFTVKPEEFEGLLSAVNAIATKAHARTTDEFLSFCVVRQIDGEFEGAEFKIGYDFGEPFYRALIDALDRSNEAGIHALTEQFRYVYPE